MQMGFFEKFRIKTIFYHFRRNIHEIRKDGLDLNLGKQNLTWVELSEEPYGNSDGMMSFARQLDPICRPVHFPEACVLMYTPNNKTPS